MMAEIASGFGYALLIVMACCTMLNVLVVSLALCRDILGEKEDPK